MRHLVLYAVGGIYLVTAVYMFIAPQSFYDTTPGVSMMGPFNVHFIRDAGLAYLVSGGALVTGAARRDVSAALFGAAWPCLHALFHVSIWVGRGFPVDFVAFVNLAGIQGPAWTALAAGLGTARARRAA